MCEMILIYLPAKAVYVGLNREQGAFIMSIYGAVQAFSQIFVGILADFIHIPTSYILMFSLVSMSAIAVAFIYCLICIVPLVCILVCHWQGWVLKTKIKLFIMFVINCFYSLFNISNPLFLRFLSVFFLLKLNTSIFSRNPYGYLRLGW